MSATEKAKAAAKNIEGKAQEALMLKIRRRVRQSKLKQVLARPKKMLKMR